MEERAPCWELEHHLVVSGADLDEAHAALESVYLPLRLQLLQGPGPVGMRLSAVRVGAVTIGHARFERDVRIVTSDAVGYHVNIPLAGRTESRTGREDPVMASPERAAVFLPDQPGDIRWQRECEQLCLEIGREQLQAELEGMIERPVPRIEFGAAMDMTTPAAGAWMDTLSLAVRDAGRLEGLLRHPLAAHHFERLIIDGLLLAQPHGQSEALLGPRPPARPRAVRESIDLMEAHPDHPWTPTELGRRTAVSARSLQEAFRRSGVPSPMAYLRDVRLARVRAELAEPGHGVITLSEVAGRWGFVHLGRFAGAYRRKYGERPSDTLRRRDPAIQGVQPSSSSACSTVG
jgi:AraC-like DNA-binding protein